MQICIFKPSLVYLQLHSNLSFSNAKIPKMDQEKRNQTEKRSGKSKRDLTEEEKARRRERELILKPTFHR